jgi:hypothetical protein
MKNPLPFLVLMLCTSVALAEPPAPPANETQNAATELVNKQFLTPLKKAESKRKRFSRAAPAPVQRRVRVLDTEAQADVRGKKFVRFAIDLRRTWDEQGSWEEDSVVGCAYPDEREVFVQHGEAYLSARSTLGAEDKQGRADVCRVAPAGTVQVAGDAQ